MAFTIWRGHRTEAGHCPSVTYTVGGLGAFGARLQEGGWEANGMQEWVTKYKLKFSCKGSNGNNVPSFLLSRTWSSQVGKRARVQLSPDGNCWFLFETIVVWCFFFLPWEISVNWP